MRPEDSYVALWRAARRGADRLGVLARLEGSGTPRASHLRSLFAIHDVEDMARLDLAWWTYAAIAEVKDFLAARSGQARVFEYGAGASTLWLGRRAREVHSVEHNPAFASLLADLLGPFAGVHLHLVPAQPSENPLVPSRRRGHQNLDFSGYVAAIDRIPGEFDLIVVDGRARVAAARRSLSRLAPGGMLLLDDARRREYSDITADPDLNVRFLRSATPSLPYKSTTALITPKQAVHAHASARNGS